MANEDRDLPQTVFILGIPFDGNSSYLRGPAGAPALIRAALFSDSSNLWTEDGTDLGSANLLRDCGDLALEGSAASAFPAIEAGIGKRLTSGDPLISLGGDHSITYPTLKAFHAHWPSLTILHFDAHPDLYDNFDGNRLSHACPFARIMEEGLAQRLIQIGIRTLNQHQREQASRFGAEIISMRNLSRIAALNIEGSLFISFDLDVLDPAFAPGVSHYEPGGMSVREVIEIVQSLTTKVVGADIVEYNPTRDTHSQTAMVAAKVLKEIAAVMLRKEKAGEWP
jgi:arginase